MSIWFYEEQKHALVLMEYLRRFRPELVPTEAELHAVRFPFDPAPALETLMLHFCGEIRLTQWYRRAADWHTEPVIKRIYETLSGDEARHAGAYFKYMKRAIANGGRRRRRSPSPRSASSWPRRRAPRKPLHPTNLHVNKALFPLDTVQSRLPDPEWLERWLDSQIQFDKAWEGKVVQAVLAKLSHPLRPHHRQRVGPQPLPQGAPRGSRGQARHRPEDMCACAFRDFESKICDPRDFAARAKALPRPLVFTNGVFDILHRGHVTYLAEARALGAALAVALNSDASVKRLGKGDDRPINALEDRMAVVAALESVVARHLVRRGHADRAHPRMPPRTAREGRRLARRADRRRRRGAGPGAAPCIRSRSGTIARPRASSTRSACSPRHESMNDRPASPPRWSSSCAPSWASAGS